MTFMRQRLAHLEEERWLDAVVVDFEHDWALVETVLAGERYLLWNHEDLRTWLWGNDLVSFSEKYNTLGVRDNRLNVIAMKQGVSVDDALATLLG